MKLDYPNRWSLIFQNVLKIILSAFTGCAFVFLLAIIFNVNLRFMMSQAPDQNIIRVENAQLPSHTVSHPDVNVFWPRFLCNTSPHTLSSVINGVQIITEDWSVGASTFDVLSYYREQMTARGWLDATEETYGFQTELRSAANVPQDEHYVDDYRKVMDSNLVLTKGTWSLHITTDPGKNNGRVNTVHICAASTPNMKKYFEGVGLALLGKQGPPSPSVDVLQGTGREQYHTIIVTKNETPAQAFQEALAKVGAQGWRSVLLMPAQQTQSGYFAWLVRGKDYAALSVKALPQGQDSSVTLTEVAPESGQNR